LEAAAGRPIEFSGTGTAAGLMSLVAGGADVAMLSSPLDDAARIVNGRTPGLIEPTQLHAEHIGEARIVFIVNPRNPVRTLSAEQLAGVLTGRIDNWQQVGGSEAPIVVVSLGNGGSLLDPVLKGASITPRARKVTDASHIPTLVAEDANAIGIVSSTHPRGKTSLLQTDMALTAPLYLVTRGEGDESVARLVQRARQLLQ
jgi:phosphate transport system substrate-binding protein